MSSAAAEAAHVHGEAVGGAQARNYTPRGLAQPLPPQRKQARNQPSLVARGAASTVLTLQLLFGSTLIAVQAIYKQPMLCSLSSLPYERISFDGRASSSRKSDDARAALVSITYLLGFVEPGLRSMSVRLTESFRSPARRVRWNAGTCLSTLAELTQELWLKFGWLPGMDIAEQVAG